MALAPQGSPWERGELKGGAPLNGPLQGRGGCSKVPNNAKAFDDAERRTAVMLARAAESKDPSSGSHIDRIFGYTLLLGRGLGLGEERAQEIACASMLHDIGKLTIPHSILEKPGALTPEEWLVMQRHPMEGVEMLKPSPTFDLAREIVRWHHERWDGSGYPDGLRGKEIPPSAAIVAVADVYDALTSRRAYKAAWEAGHAIEELQRMAGVLLYPDAVDVLADLWRNGTLRAAGAREQMRVG